MKKIAGLLCFIMLLCTGVSAAPADMNSVPTDIRVIMHGAQIPAACVNNSMYIAAEDLAHYGYAVTYKDEVRTLFVNKVSENTPREPLGGNIPILSTLETDIEVYLNGEQVNKNGTFAYGGKMYLNVSAIARYRDGKNYSDPGDVGYPHLLTSKWDGENRILYVENSPLLPKDEQRAKLMSYGGNRQAYSTFLSFTETSYPGEGFEVLQLHVGGLPHGSNDFWYYINDDGRFYSINSVTAPYAFRDYWGACEIRNARVEGKRLYFEAHRMLSREPVIKTVYGEYYLDLDTTVVNIIDEKE